jgi:hypothetical protein
MTFMLGVAVGGFVALAPSAIDYFLKRKGK